MTSPRHPGVARALSTLLAIALALSACGGDTADNKPVDLSDSTQVNVVALFDRSGSTATKSGGMAAELELSALFGQQCSSQISDEGIR